jgi:hypothetical protein
MTPAMLLWWLSILLAIAGAIVYAVGVVRRWRPGAGGKPAWASEPGRFMEPWTMISFALILAAIMAQAVARMVSA